MEKGFTLIETLIYTALFALVVGFFASFSISISEMRNKQHAMADLLAEKRSMGDLIVFYTKNAREVVEPLKKATSTFMILKNRDLTTIKIYEYNGGVYADAQGVTTAISGNDMRVHDLMFANLSDTGTDAIKVTGIIASATSSSQDFAYEDNLNINARIPF